LPIRLSARKSTAPSYPSDLRTLGDHLRRKRLDLGLLQRELAQQLGIAEASIWQWENNRTKPKIHLIPGIYDFLGYAPYEVPAQFADWLRQVRMGLGLSRRKLAAKLGMDVTTIDRWERGRGQPTADPRARLRRLLDRR